MHSLNSDLKNKFMYQQGIVGVINVSLCYNGVCICITRIYYFIKFHDADTCLEAKVSTFLLLQPCLHKNAQRVTYTLRNYLHF